MNRTDVKVSVDRDGPATADWQVKGAIVVRISVRVEAKDSHPVGPMVGALNAALDGARKAVETALKS